LTLIVALSLTLIVVSTTRCMPPAASDAAALPAIAVSPVQGYDGFVMVLVKTP
jgi:CBS-domain-containing membrane protein